MKILSFEEINNVCDTIVTNSEKHDLFLHVVFDILNKTGLRCNEVLEFDRWTILSSNLFQVATEKKSNPRIFQTSELNPIFSDLLFNNATYLVNHNYKSVARKFKLFCPYRKLAAGNKQISTHLFRHKKIKELKQEGKTEVEIQAYMGEKDVKNIFNYINSSIVADN